MIEDAAVLTDYYGTVEWLHLGGRFGRRSTGRERVAALLGEAGNCFHGRMKSNNAQSIPLSSSLRIASMSSTAIGTARRDAVRDCHADAGWIAMGTWISMSSNTRSAPDRHDHRDVGQRRRSVPGEKIAEIARRKRVLFHTDAIRAWADPDPLAGSTINSLALSAHKLRAGRGRALCEQALRLQTAAAAGERRAGTENVASIVGLGKAAECAGGAGEEDSRVRALQDRLAACSSASPILL